MCPEGQAFPAGMSHALQMLHGNHSQFGGSQAWYLGHKISKKSYRLGSFCNWSSFRMSFNILERETSYCFLRFGRISTELQRNVSNAQDDYCTY